MHITTAGFLDAVKVLFKKLPSKDTAIKFINKHGAKAIEQAYKDKDAVLKQAPGLAKQLKSGQATADNKNLIRSLLILIALAVLGNGLPANASDAVNMCTSNEACTIKVQKFDNMGEAFTKEFKHLVDDKGSLDQAAKDLKGFFAKSPDLDPALKDTNFKFYKDSKLKQPVRDVKELLSLKSVFLGA